MQEFYKKKKVILPVQTETQNSLFLQSCAGRSAGLGFQWAAELSVHLVPEKHFALLWS